MNQDFVGLVADRLAGELMSASTGRRGSFGDEQGLRAGDAASTQRSEQGPPAAHGEAPTAPSPWAPARLHGVQPIGSYVVAILDIEQVDPSGARDLPVIFVYDTAGGDAEVFGNDVDHCVSIALTRLEESLGWVRGDTPLTLSVSYPALLTAAVPDRVAESQREAEGRFRAMGLVRRPGGPTSTG